MNFKKLFIPLLFALVIAIMPATTNASVSNNNIVITTSADLGLGPPNVMTVQSTGDTFADVFVVNVNNEMMLTKNVSADNSLHNITKQTFTANVMVEANLTTDKINLMDTQGTIGESPQAGQNLTADLTGTNTMVQNSAAVASMNCSSKANRILLYDMTYNYSGANLNSNFV
ncbi:MAG: hypothetical protein HY973_03425 [Candidatus Kerfeldbacteria bacterium]|nr:hypothetical protein [Candidatus Kerfeldbacteria bacterium]